CASTLVVVPTRDFYGLDSW
nr:immunoglobulin heavy chain junction region [Macaca mulatta]MOW48143.1 immunoglobulin heavy chain junction region [Macaca mulatta]